MSKTKLAIVGLSFLTFVFGTTAGIIISRRLPFHSPPSTPSTNQDPYIAFIKESYQIIQDNYWDKIDDQQLVRLFTAAAEKLQGQTQTANFKYTKDNFFKHLKTWLQDLPQNKRKPFVAQMVDLVLANLYPPGRSRLYVKKDELALKNQVQNKAETDFYQLLEVDKNANLQTIQQKYQQKRQQLEKQNTPEAKTKLRQLDKAYQTLTDPAAKKRYEQTQIATTVEGRLITPQILHLRINRFSPTTFDDLKRVTQKFDQGDQLDTLILDLRDNIGGAIDGLPYFLGPFIGPDQYAYEFLHKGQKEPYKTKIGWLPSLVRYKKVVILINRNTQSSAEVFASVLKKYNVGVLVGTTTKGWGTIERVFPIKNQIDPNEKYSIFLVHRLTLREDGQPIEGKGVEPVIDITQPNWKQQLYRYIPDQNLITAVEKVWKE